MSSPSIGPWKSKEPSAEVVQAHFVNARAHELNRTTADDFRNETIELFLQEFAEQVKGTSTAKKRGYCEKIYDSFTKELQSRDLTINIQASSWFAQENQYESYSQMYEKAIDPSSQKMFLTDADKLNPANIRAATDDRITFPPHWENVSSAPARHGLTPGNQPTSNIASRMRSGVKIPTTLVVDPNYLDKTLKPDGTVAYQSKNPKFDPKTKQVFAALNYGKRPHGSSTQYGNSYFVLCDQLKVDAIYFSGDTFYISGAGEQLTYQTLGALFYKSKPVLRRLLLNSCFCNQRLNDTSSATELVEAHLFSQVRFGRDVVALYLEPTNEIIRYHAKTFCKKWNIALKQSG